MTKIDRWTVDADGREGEREVVHHLSNEHDAVSWIEGQISQYPSCGKDEESGEWWARNADDSSTMKWALVR